MLVAVDLGNEEIRLLSAWAMGTSIQQPQAVRRWLEPLVKRLGSQASCVTVIRPCIYKTVARKLDVEHQICQFHVRRWVGRTLKELRVTIPEDWLWVIDEVKLLITELPLEGSRRLFELWKQIPERRAGRDQPLSPLDQLRLLLIRLSEHWPNYRVFDWQPDVPWTNNGTEQVIGRMKMRSHTVRGYKSWPGMWAALMMSGSGMA